MCTNALDAGEFTEGARRFVELVRHQRKSIGHEKDGAGRELLVLELVSQSKIAFLKERNRFPAAPKPGDKAPGELGKLPEAVAPAQNLRDARGIRMKRRIRMKRLRCRVVSHRKAGHIVILYTYEQGPKPAQGSLHASQQSAKKQ
jgi:hypothetical protein